MKHKGTRAVMLLGSLVGCNNRACCKLMHRLAIGDGKSNLDGRPGCDAHNGPTQHTC
jgi:hypothetical protein